MLTKIILNLTWGRLSFHWNHDYHKNDQIFQQFCKSSSPSSWILIIITIIIIASSPPWWETTSSGRVALQIIGGVPKKQATDHHHHHHHNNSQSPPAQKSNEIWSKKLSVKSGQSAKELVLTWQFLQILEKSFSHLNNAL